jgi:N-acetylglutamate synthase-like GNAT family acetyltransferase
MRIINLKECVTALSVIAQWHHDEWRDYNPGQTLEQRVQNMQRHLDSDLIPSTFVAINQDVVGSAAIVEHDMDIHQELTPWLASVYVEVPSRGQGIGTSLVSHVMQHAKTAGITSLYLFTPDRQNFYQRLGWEVLSHEDYRGHEVTVMSVLLNDVS